MPAFSFQGDPMSRYTFQKTDDQNNPVWISYGFDHACGYFYQEFDAEDECLLDLDSLFGGLTGVQLAEHLCGKENIPLPEETPPHDIPSHHITRMMLDLPF
jgi:hypothetical protein